MELNRIFPGREAPRAPTGDGRRGPPPRRGLGDPSGDALGRPPGDPLRSPLRKVGALKLPLPSGGARAESLDDGSLQIVDALPLGPLGDFVAWVADLVRGGEIEPPASFAVAVSDGTTVRFDRGGARDDAAERMAAAIQGIGESIREGRVDPQAFTLSLECGCGLRLSRDDRAPPAQAARAPDPDPRST